MKQPVKLRKRMLRAKSPHASSLYSYSEYSS
jgi:hypothetical protein